MLSKPPSLQGCEESVEADIVSRILHNAIAHQPAISQQVEEEVSFHEDFVFIKQLQKCIRGEGSLSLLNCKEVKRRYEDLVKVRHSAPGGFIPLRTFSTFPSSSN